MREKILEGCALGLVCFFLSPGVHAASQSAAEPILVLTTHENGRETDTEFMCAGTIHGYLTLPTPAVNEHVLVGKWILPNGQVAEQTKISLHFPPPGRRTAYLWLAFEPRTTGILGGVDPKAEQERQSYNGRWQLEIRWDEKPLLKTSFDVRCI